MSHPKLRAAKDCLNCGETVPDRFCSHCGQENIENNAPYHYLIQHFIEDFTHYDGQFWDTFKILICSPGQLTNIYLKGQRMRYVSPVKLYIFISFLAFFIPPLVGSFVHHKESISINFSGTNEEEEDFATFLKEELYQVDSKTRHLTFSDRLIYKPLAEKYIEMHDRGFNKEQIADRIIDSFIHNLPRAIFIFLPLFAFILWLFHSKQRWYYYAHGIFTLHFFSMILLVSMFSTLESYFNDSIMKTPVGDVWMFVFDIVDYIAIAYIIIYFWLALKRVYQESWFIVFAKGTLILTLSTVCFFALLIAMTVFSIKVTH